MSIVERSSFPLDGIGRYWCCLHHTYVNVSDVRLFNDVHDTQWETPLLQSHQNIDLRKRYMYT